MSTLHRLPVVPRTARFRPAHTSNGNRFGTQGHVLRTGHWVAMFTYAPLLDFQRGDFEAALQMGGPTGIFALHDPRRPRPLFWRNAPDGAVPALTIRALDKTGQALRVQGAAGDVISTGDPIAFTHAGQRHYFQAGANLLLDGTEQDLPVFLRPRIAATALEIAAERIRPDCYFRIAINDAGGETDLFTTDFSVDAVEHWIPPS